MPVDCPGHAEFEERPVDIACRLWSAFERDGTLDEREVAALDASLAAMIDAHIAANPCDEKGGEPGAPFDASQASDPAGGILPVTRRAALTPQ